jgi:sterol desaturase/sphingolipid hydroxylase (fatty acid hydroxylase superfamily)
MIERLNKFVIIGVLYSAHPELTIASINYLSILMFPIFLGLTWKKDTGPVVLPMINIGLSIVEMNLTYRYSNISYAYSSLFQMTYEIIFLLIVHDVYFYYAHLLCHVNPFLYRNVHKPHHKLYNKSWRGAFYMHPLEAILVVAPSVALGIYILSQFIPVSASTCIVWMNMAIFDFMWTHGNTSAGWAPALEEHAIHHNLFNYNYSSKWIDVLHGTYLDPKDVKNAGAK